MLNFDSGKTISYPFFIEAFYCTIMKMNSCYLLLALWSFYLSYFVSLDIISRILDFLILVLSFEVFFFKIKHFSIDLIK